MLSEKELRTLGRKLTDKYIRENIHIDLNTFKGKTPRERLYNYFHPEPHLCAACGNPVEFISFSKGYREYCSTQCQISERAEKTRRTCLERYGRPFPKNVNKAKQTCLERYGVEHASQAQVIKDKAKQTCLERYGRTTGLNIEKSKQTCLERYGVEHIAQTPSMIKKSKQTKLDRYGDAGYNNRNKAAQTCLERYGVDSALKNPEVRDKIRSTIKNKYGAPTWAQAQCLEKNSNIIHVNDDGTLTMKCPHPECIKCQERNFVTTSQLYRDRQKINSEVCTKLLPIQQSRSKGTSGELYIREILNKNHIGYQTNIKLPSGKEIDIYIPKYHLAIEFNGYRWHSEKFHPKKYHYDKFNECAAAGNQLISIWEDWYIHKPDIIRSLILSKLGIYQNRFGARQCDIRFIPARIAEPFLEQNHIQGSCHAGVNIGMFFNDRLVSVMSFGKKRPGLGSPENTWELLRFCTLLDTQIIGGANKLLKHFISHIKPVKIVSFSSNDISTGALYKRLNFQRKSESLGYWYIDGKTATRYHRFTFTKRNILKKGLSNDPTKTESEMMSDLGYYKIWDSGTIKWELEFYNQH